MDKLYQDLFDVLVHDVGMSATERENQRQTSLATSGTNKAQLIHDFIFSK